MLAKEFISALKSVIGTCMTMGVLVESKDPKEVLEEISQGKYKKEIESKQTEISEEKKKEITGFFSDIRSKQEASKKKEEEEKVAAEAAKAQEATAKPAAGDKKAEPVKTDVKPVKK